MKEILPYYRPVRQPITPKMKQRDFTLLLIVCAVLILHGALILFSTLSFQNNKPSPKERLIVKTVALNPHQETMIAYVPATLADKQPTSFTPPSPSASPSLSSQPAPPSISLSSQPEPIAFNKLSSVEIAKEEKPGEVKKAVPKKAVTQVSKSKTVPVIKKSLSDKKPLPINDKNPPASLPRKPIPQPVKKAVETLPKVDPAAEARKARQRELLSKAKESIAHLEKNRSTSAVNAKPKIVQTDLPKTIGSLQIEAITFGEKLNLTSTETSYRDEIAHRLKLGLRLPEYGEVKIKLTLQRLGKVVSLQILSSKNGKNKEYIEKTLPTLTFPSFGDNFVNCQQYEFIICLNNE